MEQADEIVETREAKEERLRQEILAGCPEGWDDPEHKEVGECIVKH